MLTLLSADRGERDVAVTEIPSTSASNAPFEIDGRAELDPEGIAEAGVLMP
jgi:hypothetical protein